MASDAGRITAQAFPDSIRIPGDWTEPIDVLLDDHRVFTIAPDRHVTRSDGGRTVPWPKILRRYLTGATTVSLRGHVSATPLLTQNVTFDAAPRRVRVVDDEGFPLVMTKWGDLARPFESNTAEAELLLADVKALLRVLNDVVGVPAFIAYGTLLGAVREGMFIGHDTDADIAYYSRYENPVDIMRESFVVQRRLGNLGWLVRRKNGGFLQVSAAGEGERRRIDLFVSYHVSGWFAMNKWVRGRMPPESILPLGEATLEGMTLPAPREPSHLLTATYGANWYVPDPAFKFSRPPSLWQRAEGWFGLWTHDLQRWQRANKRAARIADSGPSGFAKFAEDRLGDRSVLVDVGCGRGADAIWFARNGRMVLGLDYVAAAVHRASEQALVQGVAARFEVLNLYDLRVVVVTAGLVAAADAAPVLYVRNVLENLQPAGRANLWLMAKVALGGGGALCLEFEVDRLTGGPQEVITDIARAGGVVTDEERGTQDGRDVSRMVATWPTSPVGAGDVPSTVSHAASAHQPARTS
jgi:SAM-dependent methyltransferase